MVGNTIHIIVHTLFIQGDGTLPCMCLAIWYADLHSQTRNNDDGNSDVLADIPLPASGMQLTDELQQLKRVR